MDFTSKEVVRAQIWNLLEERNIASFPRPCKGRIPNFVRSNEACKRLEKLSEFSSANCVFSAPDYVLTKARELVLHHGKSLAVATPHMKKFLELSGVPEDEVKRAATIRGFELYGRRLSTRIDLIVQGSVAVDKKGNRIGKGKGYGDREYHVLKRLDMLNPQAMIATIVHEAQVLDDLGHLMNENDVKVDYVLTPSSSTKV